MADSLTDYLAGDHRLCDDLLVVAEQLVDRKEWEKALPRFEEFRKALVRHLAMEEEVLFPAFEEATGMDGGPTYVMRSEHEQMRDLMGELSTTLANQDKDGFLGRIDTLNVLVQQHNVKEEQMLYPMADDALGGEAADVLKRMRGISA